MKYDQQKLAEIRVNWGAALKEEVLQAAINDWDEYDPEVQEIIADQLEKRSLQKEAALYKPGRYNFTRETSSRLVIVKERISRFKFLFYGLLIFTIYGIIVSTTTRLNYTSHSFWHFVILFIVTLTFFISFIVICIKRLHDIGNEFLKWLFLVPGINIIVLLLMIFKRGARGPNRYGPDPLENRYEDSLKKNEVGYGKNFAE